MKALWVLRHAKSSWDDARLDDHDRPLNRRGERAAAGVAAWLARHPTPPSLVLCSSAKRTRQTLEPIQVALAPRLRALVERELYLADADALLARIARLGENERSVMLIGHNPGLHELAVRLAARGARDLLARLRAKLPTAALALLELDVAHWRDVELGCARLAERRTPRDPD